LAVGYLVLSLACNGFQLATAIRHAAVPSAVLLGALVGLQLVLVLCESRGKDDILLDDELRTPRQLAGLLSRLFFAWINPVLLKGYRDVLSNDDLPLLDPSLSSRHLRHEVLQAWEQRGTQVVAGYASYSC
jgi:ATP-binding cassette, subfamily C (CFTR/MRP), member 1